MTTRRDDGADQPRCHNGHPFEPGVAENNAPSDLWCNVCGERRRAEPAAPPPAPTYCDKPGPHTAHDGCEGVPWMPTMALPTAQNVADALPPPAPTEDEVEAQAQQVGDDLARLGFAYRALGNDHEFRHVVAAVKAGMSDDCTDGRCVLDRAPTEDVAALVERLRLPYVTDSAHREAANALERLAADLAAARADWQFQMEAAADLFILKERAEARADLAESQVAAVRALCDSYERSGYPDALIPKGQTIAEFRRALDSATPAATEDAGV